MLGIELTDISMQSGYQGIIRRERVGLFGLIIIEINIVRDYVKEIQRPFVIPCQNAVPIPVLRIGVKYGHDSGQQERE